MLKHIFKMIYRLVFIVILCSKLSHCLFPFGPPYPVTGSWFKDRFSLAEWNTTLNEFSRQGGDTVLLRSPAMKLVQYEDLAEDPNFKWCGSNFRNNPADEYRDCYNEAVKDLQQYDITVSAIALYQYEEDYDASAIIQCPQYEKRIVSDRVYYRLVLPMSEYSDPCVFNGTSVLLLFTIFSGIDPHELLLTTAAEHNMSVYFGLPLPPTLYKNGHVLNTSHMPAYYEFVRRILVDHRTRYSHSNSSKEIVLYDTVKGYMWSDDILLTDIGKIVQPNNITYTGVFKILANHIHENKKRFGISTYVQSNKFEGSLTLEDNAAAFSSFVVKSDIDVISVKDGRGSAYGALFWETQTNSRIDTTDAELYQLLNYYYPSTMRNLTLKTFDYFFNFSIYEVFETLAAKRDDLKKSGYNVDLWLNIEAFDALHDDPCLQVDTTGSAMDRLVNSVTKSRIDRVLTHAGSSVQKVVAFAWDPSFTCKTKAHHTPLRNLIVADSERPIIAHCSFHSSFNRSVVVMGYNLMRETQGFTIDWPNVNGHRVVSQVHGYYFELDWGIQHDRIPSLMYIQMYDPYDIMELAQKGYVKVTADGGYHTCAFKYDFTRGEGFANFANDRQTKKYYRIVQRPVHRIYGQDIPFALNIPSI
ncbi:uncharacterized protein LOC123558822 [Mercenaria mercenaria]|uniref:uncharacterized protein LOC123558822 n=1 Tax=Mercenaria mercenaria TaxID=6596 RepID=UPI00234F1B24|nr:uncharacterized protein LOC123558822 [Mercenaria mercenaria]